jgi:hypothetical protein
MLKKQTRKYKPKAGQYTLDAGLKKFGSRGEMAVTKELRQFNTYEVFEPLEANTLDEEEKKGAPSLLIFHKEKQNGDVKEQSFANGTVQQNCIAKEEVALPTVGLKSVLPPLQLMQKRIEKLLQSTFLGFFFMPPIRIMW